MYNCAAKLNLFSKYNNFLFAKLVISSVFFDQCKEVDHGVGSTDLFGIKTHQNTE